MKRNRFAAIALGLIATTTFAHDYTIGELKVIHPYAFATTPTAMTGAGYLTVTNTGTEDDRLIRVEADFPRVMIHTTTMADGVASMSHVEAVDLPAGETISLAPGGYHVMFMGLNGDPLEPGESIPAMLIFEKAGAVAVTFAVEMRGEDDGATMDHGAHQAGN